MLGFDNMDYDWESHADAKTHFDGSTWSPSKEETWLGLPCFCKQCGYKWYYKGEVDISKDTCYLCGGKAR